MPLSHSEGDFICIVNYMFIVGMVNCEVGVCYICRVRLPRMAVVRLSSCMSSCILKKMLN